MKIAKNEYASFENSEFDHVLRPDDLFVVSPEFEKNPAFKEGMRVGSFKIVEIDSVGQLNKVIGITDEMIEDFWESQELDEIQEIVEPPEVPIPESIPEPAPEPEPEVPEVPEKEEEALAFTEETDSWQAAVALVKKETDVEKLVFALRKDERKSVKKACVARLAELKDEIGTD